MWYDADALEAAEFYISIFNNGRILKVNHYGEGTPAVAGSVLTVHFELAGQEYIALNGGPKFSFNPSIFIGYFM